MNLKGRLGLGCFMITMEKEELKKVKKWIINEMECSLSSYTYPRIEKASHKGFKEAIKQNKDCDEKGGELEQLKEAYEIFKIIEKWQKTKKYVNVDIQKKNMNL